MNYPNNRREKRANARKNQTGLAHLLKVQKMAKQLVNSKVLKVFPEENRAIFPVEIWQTKDDSFKSTFIKNIALYLLHCKYVKPVNEPMEAELYSVDLELLASFKNKKVTIYV